MRNELLLNSDNASPVVSGPVPDGMTVQPEATDPQQQGDPIELPAPAFRVYDASTASWVLRKINEARAYAKRVEAWAATELRRAEREEAWLFLRFGRELEDWLRSELSAQGARRRSMNLPGGTVGLRQSPARVLVVDESKAVDWCGKQLPAALKVSLEVKGKAAVALTAWRLRHAPESTVRQRVLIEPLRGYMAQCGELPPGVDLRPASDELYVK